VEDELTTTETSRTTKPTRTKWVGFKNLTAKAGILQSQDSYCNLRIADYTVTYAERSEFSTTKGGKVEKDSLKPCKAIAGMLPLGLPGCSCCLEISAFERF
jgi:hypothetical protein